MNNLGSVGELYFCDLMVFVVKGKVVWKKEFMNTCEKGQTHSARVHNFCLKLGIAFRVSNHLWHLPLRYFITLETYLYYILYIIMISYNLYDI